MIDAQVSQIISDIGKLRIGPQKFNHVDYSLILFDDLHGDIPGSIILESGDAYAIASVMHMPGELRLADGRRMEIQFIQPMMKPTKFGPPYYLVFLGSFATADA